MTKQTTARADNLGRCAMLREPLFQQARQGARAVNVKHEAKQTRDRNSHTYANLAPAKGHTSDLFAGFANSVLDTEIKIYVQQF
jgi:hypothetical protein